MTALKEYVARRVELDEQIERLTQERDQINDKLRELPYGNNDAGDWTVQIQANRRLDAAAFTQHFPVTQYPHFFKPTVDTAALKEYLAPIELEKFYLEGTKKVVIK